MEELSIQSGFQFVTTPAACFRVFPQGTELHTHSFSVLLSLECILTCVYPYKKRLSYEGSICMMRRPYDFKGDEEEAKEEYSRRFYAIFSFSSGKTCEGKGAGMNLVRILTGESYVSALV